MVSNEDKTEHIEVMKQHIDSLKVWIGSEPEDEIMERLNNMSKVESSINYNLLLSQRKNMLKKEIDRIDSELILQQDVCDHIKVCIGWDGPFLYRDTSICKCLLCGENEPDSKYPIIEAYDYKKEIYSHGEISSYREDRFIELQNLAINILNKKSDLSIIQLVEIMSDIIKNPVSSKYQDLAIACHTNPEIQLNFNKPAIQVEQKSNTKIGITGGHNFMRQFIEKLNSGEIKIETCPQVETEEELTEEFILQQLEKYQSLLDNIGIIDDISKEEQGPILKKTKK